MLAKAGPVACGLCDNLLAWALTGETAGVGLSAMCRRPAAADHAIVLARSAGPADRSAVLISIIGFVESVSVAQTLAAKKRQRIVPDQELIGLARRQCRRGVHRRLPGHRWLCALGGQLRCRRRNACRRRLHRGGCWQSQLMLLTPLIYIPSAGHACRHHHRCGAVAGGLLDPEEDLGLFARRFCRRRWPPSG
jgi:hypothetical protein